MLRRPLIAWLLALALSACGGGATTDDSGCNGSCASAASFLSTAQVEDILSQAIAEAQARATPATIAVVDRVGNVLAVYRMDGAATAVRTDGGRGTQGGLDDLDVIPDSLAAIAKALTGAYLSSEGNAFTTRTASQIVQEFFNPGEVGQLGGPLFGVQFSSLPCSDVSTRLVASRPSVGPHRSPLGLAADPGGLPLYLNGVPVGAVGVIADGVYGLDPNVLDRDQSVDELIAIAATQGYAAPRDRRADRITVDGKSFRFTDTDASDLLSDPAAAPAFAGLPAATGALITVPGYVDNASIVAGLPFGQAASGVSPSGLFASFDAFELVDAAGNNRYPPSTATDGALLAGAALSAAEVQALLEEGLRVANRARAQIRRPLNSAARVSIAVVDTQGVILGLVRTRDAPIFGTDVAVQKARTAAFFSNAAAADDLLNTPDTQYFGTSQIISFADYLSELRDFLGLPTALADGAVAFSDRAGGNLSRPYFPDGQPGSENGPLSKPIDDWSVFSVGLQLDLVNSAVLQHVVFALGGGPDVAAGRCTQLPDTANGTPRLPNGIQIFPGSVPIYRGNELIGGIGVSGDGIDQDDMISFLAVHNAGLRLGGINNAAPAIRADQLTPKGTRLRYVQCPQAPFLDSNEQRACSGK